MNKFIPGPWTSDGEGFIIVDEGDELNEIQNFGLDKPIAMVRGWSWLQREYGDSEAYKIQMANAKLLAAAPDLLRTLELCLACKAHKESVESMKQMIREAIKKATE